MVIAGLGTAAPAQRYTQRECWDTLLPSREYHELTPRSRAILKKVLTGENGITTRHLALDNLNDAFQMTPDTLHARFIQNAPALAAQAAERALANASLQANEIDGLIISTCTGYLCPGLTSYVSQRLALRPDVLLLDLVGQGCGAALPNLRTGGALLQAGRCRNVLSICVEVCSAAFYLDNDPGVLISACLFGDGAGAAVLTNDAGSKRRLEWKLDGSMLEPENRDALRFEQKAGMLRNILSLEVPGLAAQSVEKMLEQVLARAGVKRSQVAGWALHPGGRDVLLALRQQLGLRENDLRWSASVLNEFGNLSSASLYFVMEAALADSPPNGLWFLSSFGAGFSCHGALMEIEV
jgi:alkylresorcinol/alkylpyrone synthase